MFALVYIYVVRERRGFGCRDGFVVFRITLQDSDNDWQGEAKPHVFFFILACEVGG